MLRQAERAKCAILDRSFQLDAGQIGGWPLWRIEDVRLSELTAISVCTSQGPRVRLRHYEGLAPYAHDCEWEMLTK